MSKKLKFLAMMLTCILLSINHVLAATLDFTAQGYANNKNMAGVSLTVDGVTATFAKGSSGSNPTYFTSGTAVRVYYKNTITVTSSSTMSSIAFTFGSSDGSNTISASVGSYSSGTWTGSATSVTFTIGGTSGNRRVQKLVVTTSGSTKTLHYWNGTDDFDTDDGGATLPAVPSLCDDAIEPYGWTSDDDYASRSYPTGIIWFKDDSWPAGETDLYAVYRTGSNPNYYYSTQPNVYTITYNLTNVTKDATYSYDCTSDMLSMPSGSAITDGNMWAYFKPADGYTLDESCISITMGGSPVSSSNYDWNPNYSYPEYDYTAELAMEGITGNLVVTVTGKACTQLGDPSGLTVNTDYEYGGNTYVRWSWTRGSNVADHATNQQVCWGKVGESGTCNTTARTNTSAGRLKSNFEDGTYWWSVQALGDGTDYCSSNVVTAASTFTICNTDISGSSVTVNAATSITATGATANWSAVTDADHYTVKVYEGTSASGTLRKTYSDVTGTSQAITGLTAGAATTYYIEVQAHDACGHDSNKGGVTFTTLVAHYTITYNKGANGTGDNIANGDKTHGVDFTLSSSTYSRAGYTQDGWSTSDGGAKVYNLGGTYTGNADLNLYPHWHLITYSNYRTTCGAAKTLDYITITTAPTTVNYLTGQSFSSAGAVVTATYTDGTSATVAPASVTWTPPATPLAAGTSLTVTASYTEGGITKTANQTINVYTPTVLKKDETGTAISGLLSDAPAVSCSVATLSAAATGNKYTFKEWQISGGTLGSDAGEASNSIATVTGAVTVTAVYYKPITVTWHVPSGTWDSDDYARPWTVQHPSNPTPATYGCTDKVFYGWTKTADYDDDDPPTDLVLNGDELDSNTDLYAVFALRTGEGTTDQWTKTAVSAITTGTYLICTSAGKAFNGSTSSGHGWITTEAFSSFSSSTIEENAPEGACELTLTTNSSGFSMYNSTYGYLYCTKASSGGLSWNASEQDYWWYTGSSWRYHGQNSSGTYVALSDYTTSFRTYTSGITNPVFLKKTRTGTPATYSDFSTSCACDGFSFHTGSGTDEAVKTTNTRTCFEQVESSTTWKIDDYVIPSDAKFFVGYQDEFKTSGLGSSSRSAVTQFNADEAMYFEYTKTYGDGYRPSVGNATGAIGTLRIWSDNSWNNCRVGFDPNGYIFKLGSTYLAMHNSATLDADRYKETDVIMLTSTDISGQFQVNIAAVAPNASTGVASRYTEAKNLTTMGVKSGSSTWRGSSINNAADANTKGFFRIDKGEGNATNWNAHWVPCWELTFNLKGGTGTIVTTPAYVSVEAASKVVQIPTTAPTKDGYRFMGWSDTDGGGVNYAAGSTHNVTLSGNKTVYAVWAQEYTVTYAANGGTTSCTEPNHIAGETVTVCATEPSKACSTFLGWLGDNSIGTKAASSTFTMPAANVTLTAQWNTTQYAITYKDQGDVAYSGSNGASLPDTHTCGSATVLPNGVRDGYRFDGWFDNASCTGDAITSLASDAVGPFTLYAKWTASLTFTFSKNGVVDGTLTLGQVEGGNVVMPNTTVDCGLWTTFEGWVIGDVAETTTEPATIYKPGDIYVAGSTNQEFKAVYSKHEGDGTVTYVQVTSNSVTPAGEYVIACPDGGKILTGLNGNKRGTYEAVTISDGVISSKGNGVVINVNKKGSLFNIKMSGDTKYITTCNDTYFEYSVTDGASACMWELTSEGYIHSTDHTTRYLEFLKSGTQYFGAYTGTQWKSFLFRKKVAGTTYYTTAPGSCDIPTEITVSYNDNKAHAGDQTISGMPSGTTLTFTTYPNFASYTIGSAPTDPTGYHFAGWNTSADGNGTDYAAGASVTTFGYVETITLFAKWERVYSVKLMDNGVERTTLTEASAGAGVTLPSGNNCTPGSAFTFIGWTESAVELNADPVRPASATLHTAGSYTPTDDITLYSVYSRSVAGCEDFAAGVSGAYKLYNNTTSDYAKVTDNANRYDKGSSGDAEIFYIAYAPAHSAYTIRTSLGYLGWAGAAGSENLTKTNTTPYYWNITTNGTNWNFQPVGVSGKQFSGNNTYFNLHSNSTKYYIRLEKIAMTYYYNTALCGDATITFHDGGGTISGAPTQPTGSSWNSSTHVLSGLENCDKITTFPTASYDGWTFIGWSTEDYTNSGKHTAGTSQYAAENASTDEPDGSEIYKTDGNPYVVRGGSIDLYPIFTRFPDNEPFDIENGGTYYMYYLDEGSDDGYGAPVRYYAGPWDGTKRYTAVSNCADATAFSFTKSGSVWHIQNVANDKYIGGTASDDWLVENASLGTLTDWTISIRSGNQFNASCQGARQISVFENFFMDYASINLVNNPGYHCVYLGSCEERIFSSEPNPTPTIDLTGEPIVTSSAGERVRATATMTLNAAHLSGIPANRVKLTGTNLKFATSASDNPSAELFVEAPTGSVTSTIYVYYTPAVGDTEDGIENIIVTAKAYQTTSPKHDYYTTGVVHARHLPANFVIAAKWDGKWYALPNTCAGEGSNTAGVQIEVDDDDAPTAATSAPHTAKWGLRQTKAGSRDDGSYNDRLVFTERTTAEANSQKALYNYNQAEVFTSATYTNYNNTNPERYEWIPVTADFGDYELTSANDANHHLLLRNSDGLFVAQNSDKAYDGKVRLLPATFYEEAPVQILEWKAGSVVVMYTGTETTATTKVADNSPSSAQTLASQKLTHGIYELTVSPTIGKSNTISGKNLTLTFGSTKKVFEIPVILTGSVTSFSGFEKKDIIIPKGYKLTASTSNKYNYRNIYVYGGGKLEIPANGQLGVNNIILRAGGISTDGSGGSATYEYVYPQVKLASTENFSSTKTNIKYEYITDYSHWYHLCLPFNGTLNSITYPVEYYGDNVRSDNHGSWQIKRYDGATRATGEYKAWVDIETESATQVLAGHGYIFWGAPKKLTIGGVTERSAWGIQRITMPTTAGAAISAETANKTIDGLSSYANVEGNSGKINDQGWNLIGNPYMVNLTGLTSESLKTGKLVHVEDASGNWTGKWESNGDAFRYITVPSEHFDTYEAVKVSGETVTLTAGKAFFVQMDGANTAVQFDVSKRASLMPALYATANETVDVETGIVMSDETKKDEVNFWIKDDKTDAYEYNADYPKTMNQTNFNIYGVHGHGELSWIAISPEIAEGSMAIGYQVPNAGEFTLSLSETYVSDEIEHVFVTDHGVSPEVTTDLMVEAYDFHVNQAETNNERFTVSIKLKKQDDTTTDIDNITGGDSERPIKFIYHDKMYILRGGVIYDATGKRVQINK